MSITKSKYVLFLKLALPLVAVAIFASPAAIFASTYYTDKGITSTDSLFINASVGVGTAAPAAKLDVAGGNLISQQVLYARHIDGKNWNDNSTVGDLYLQWNNTANNTLINARGGKVGVGTASPAATLDVNGMANISGGSYAVPNGRMAAGSLTIGNINANFGGGSSWNSNTAGLMLEAADNTEIAVHDSGTRLASLMYYEGGSNKIHIGRDMGWGALSNVTVNGTLTVNGYENRTVYNSDEGPRIILQNPRKTGLGNEWAIYNMTGGYGNGLEFWNYGGTGWGSKFTLTDAGGAELPGGLATGGQGLDNGYGIKAQGGSVGGYFYDSSDGSYLYAAIGTRGFEAHGISYGGYVNNANYSGYAYLGYYDNGIMAYGNNYGGYFYDRDNYTNAYIGYGNYSIYGNGWIRGTADNGYSVFIGGDGAGGDVEIGSQTSGVYALAAWNPTNAARMDIYGGAYHNLSSIRYKQNIDTIDGGLDKVRRLRGVYFEWKAPYAEFKPGRQVGVIAEEVGKVVPEVVTWDETAPGYANDVIYDDLAALLIEAVKELDAQALKIGSDGSVVVSGDLSAENNAWGTDSGWISCPETGACSCPDGSYMTSIRDRGAAVRCHKL